jgi:putative Mn2+ efflux pump MntP
MASLIQILLIVAVFGSLVLSIYSGYQRNYQEAVGGLIIAVIALAALFV